MSKELMKKRIEMAQKVLDEQKDAVSDGKWRQKFHFCTPCGWMNDPNGLIYYKGRYHFFYQFNPYSPFWGAMHWGHAVSDDMIHFENLPIALAPSEYYDDHLQGGCFSGSAIEHDGKLYLMYTGTANHGNGFVQTQNIAVSTDGINFEKYENNPVIIAPEGIKTDFFRDPKVWREEDAFYAVIGANRDGMAQVLLYRSDDMLHWEYVNVLAESRGEWGYMWECADFYPVDGKYVLMYSPMGGGERTSVYQVGDFDKKRGKFLSHTSGELDWGHDFYAPQSFATGDGRRVIVAWANGWDWMPFWKDWGPTYQENWCGMFNIPREVTVSDDGRLSIKPIRELENIRSDAKEQNDICVKNSLDIPLVDGVHYELKLKVNLEKTSAKSMVLRLRKGDGKYSDIVLDFEKSQFSFDRNNSDGWSKGLPRGPVYLYGKDTIDIDIISDRSSIEAFCDNYRTNISCNVYASDEQNQNEIIAVDGDVFIEKLETWKLC